MMFLKAFIVGGLICVIGQLLIDLTKLTPAKILVLFVCVGVLLGGVGAAHPARIPGGGALRHQPAQLWAGHRRQPGEPDRAGCYGAGHPPHSPGQPGAGGRGEGGSYALRAGAPQRQRL